MKVVDFNFTIPSHLINFQWNQSAEIWELILKSNNNNEFCSLTFTNNQINQWILSGLL